MLFLSRAEELRDERGKLLPAPAIALSPFKLKAMVEAAEAEEEQPGRGGRAQRALTSAAVQDVRWV